MTANAHPGGYPDALLAALQAGLATQLHGRIEPLMFAISGVQGSGKSTLARQLQQRMQDAEIASCVLSVDDFYLDAPQRDALAKHVHPLLATRGPPGTHDVPLALATFAALRAGEPVALPRFDKLQDRRRPAADWPRVHGVRLVIFEGWFLATPPQSTDALEVPVNARERDEDPHGAWRRHCNDALATEYPALWQQIDRLLVLQAPGFEVVPGWRWQQEQQLRDVQAGSDTAHGMSREQVQRFVQLYERVSRHALHTLPALADQVIRLDAQRRILA